MAREKRVWKVTMTVVDRSNGPESIHEKCYTQRKIEAWIRNTLSGFDSPNCAVKKVFAEEVGE